MNQILNQMAHRTVKKVQPQLRHAEALFSQVSDALLGILNVIASVKSAVLVLALSLGFLLLAPTAPSYAQTATLTPKQVVEYALTLEKLEADFYQRAIAAAQSGPLAGAPQIAKDALVSYGGDETQHVTDLSAVLTSLGGNPDAVMIPANPNYSAILGRDPFANPADLLMAGQYVEDLGVAAYKGQVQNLVAAGEAGKTVLAAALAIHSVEARHAAGIRFLRQTLLGANVRPWISNASSVIYNENRSNSVIPFSSEAFDGYATKEEVLALVKPILMTAQMPTPSRSTAPSSTETGTTIRALW
ncbi:MAG: ferritin-like domain-containing protein [Phormidesmis sp. CAN_BIN36]|nr:ferritin-like domain-containing protein [Phormidesmis sp. CAN_BIN36]